MALKKVIRNGIISLTMLAIAGCSGGSVEQQQSVNQRGYTDERVLDMTDRIRDADMPKHPSGCEWYNYGMSLYGRKNIRIVGDSELSPDFNAFSFIPEETIWVQEQCFKRYDNIDRGEILLHELVHCRTKVATHTDYQAQVQAQYRKHYGR